MLNQEIGARRARNMRTKLWLLILGGLSAVSAFGGSIIQYDVANLGGNKYSYTYSLSGLAFQAYQELDIRFDPALYSTLSNASVGNGFQGLILQPNNPPGAAGIYSAFTTTAIASPAGIFSVDFLYLGAGQPGPQEYYINLYDMDGYRVATTTSGWTTPNSAVPEPSSFWLAAGGLLMGVAVYTARRRSRATV